MKIILVHEEYPDETNFGGIATYQKRMCEEYAKMGHQVTVICRGLFNDKRYVENDVDVIRLYVKSTNNKRKDYIKYRKRVCQELLKLQNANKIDIIETPDWGAETIFFEKYRKVPLVVRLHTPLKIWLKYNKNKFGKVKRDLLVWEDKLINSADLVTCCSLALKEEMLKYFDIEKNIYVTPNPADTINFYLNKNIKKTNELIFVGSLEQRKGVLVFAESLNIVFKKYPNLKVKFVGKDTVRNDKDISTIKYIKEIVLEKYHDNLEFIGQIANNEINNHLNKARVGIFPSLFDNFPYVVLEAMRVGLQIVGSSNSGMVEMLDGNGSIYEAGDSNSLASKIIERYELSLIEPINYNVIKRVDDFYNPILVCNNMVDMYKNIIKEYDSKIISKKELDLVLEKGNLNERVLHYKRAKNGVANYVYLVRTKLNNKYVIKKYLYNYNFEISNKLYNMYSVNDINALAPINMNTIKDSEFEYNIFSYKKPDKYKRIDSNYLINLLKCDRKVDVKSTIKGKVDNYYKYLRSHSYSSYTDEVVSSIDYTINIYNSIMKNKIFNEKYLNHGDITSDNIIVSNRKKYLIDFDEACVAPCLYDFAVIIIKFYSDNNKIDMKNFNKIKNEIGKIYTKYSDEDYINIIKFYLCKILLEKFYLYLVGNIDLYSSRQLKDDYRRYVRILKKLGDIK